METTFLTVRLGEDDAAILESLNRLTGATKSDIVKRALRDYAAQQAPNVGGLFALGEKTFGKHGTSERQAADIKKIARERIDTKRTRR
jgi:hypothetical protein